jgi:hypothetical protein
MMGNLEDRAFSFWGKATVVAASVGGTVGLVIGFIAHGVGGAVVGLLAGAVSGLLYAAIVGFVIAFIGEVVMEFGPLLLVVLIVGVAILGVLALWDVGKP